MANNPKVFNRIAQENCPACGKTFIVSNKSKVLRNSEKFITTPCLNCGHIVRVEK